MTNGTKQEVGTTIVLVSPTNVEPFLQNWLPACRRLPGLSGRVGAMSRRQQHQQHRQMAKRFAYVPRPIHDTAVRIPRDGSDHHKPAQKADRNMQTRCCETAQQLRMLHTVCTLRQAKGYAPTCPLPQPCCTCFPLQGLPLFGTLHMLRACCIATVCTAALCLSSIHSASPAAMHSYCCQGCCYGCGARLQIEVPLGSGFVKRPTSTRPRSSTDSWTR